MATEQSLPNTVETKPQLPTLSSEDKKRNLESTLYQFSKEMPFFAAFMQEINISHDEQLPTAAIGYDKKQNEFRVMINPYFFADKTPEQRVAVLYHEVLHFTHGHLIRMGLTTADPEKMTPEEKIEFKNDMQIKNIAADMAINQYIRNLPDGCITVETFKDDKGKPFPEFQTYEVYYDLINKHKDNEHNKDKFQKVQTLDEHVWESLSEEEKSNMLKKAKEVTERTIEKVSREFGQGKEHVKDLFKLIDAEINKINYKNLLKMAIRKTITKHNRESTWNKPNRRYDVYAPGSKEGQVPMLNIYVDTSGSISHTEINRFLTFIKGCIKAGSGECNISLWHSNLYYSGKFKKTTTMENLPLQSGGTDVSDVLSHINKHNPDLALVITDMHLAKSEIPIKYKAIVWVVADPSGLANHPYKDIGKTILLSGVVGG